MDKSAKIAEKIDHIEVYLKFAKYKLTIRNKHFQ